PYFSIQTERFALLAVDTGVLRRVDADQLAWLRAGLEAARSKFTMVVLGHPLYAGGDYLAAPDADFAAIHHLLPAPDVQVLMAGHSQPRDQSGERHRAGGGDGVMPPVAAGGGGASPSSGTSLAWPGSPALPEWAFYPSAAALTAKIDFLTPRWKWPFWVWTKRFGAWPFSVEWLSAAFDYNAAPFFQSFVEVPVEPSAQRVRLLPWRPHGRLQWPDLQS